MSAFPSVLLMGLLLHSAHSEEFGVSLPQQMKVIRGSCLTIPCSFTIKDTFNKNVNSGCRALWKTVDKDQTVAFTRATTGDLTQKNCTTTVHEITEHQGRRVFFRVECSNPLKWTFTQTSVDIQVREAPPRPKVTPPTLRVAEGESVRVQCSAPVPCLSLPPTLTWSPVLGDVHETLQQQEDETFVKVSTLNFTVSDYETALTCTAAYSREDGTTVSSVSETAKVTCAACDKFSVSLPQNIRAVHGSCVTIPCSFKIQDIYKHNLNDKCKAIWKDASDNTLRDPRQTTGDLTQKNCTTTFRNIASSHNKKYFLRVDCGNALIWTFKDNSVNIHAIDAPPTPTLTPPTLSVAEGESVRVQCSAPVLCLSLPPTLTWSPVLGDVQETLQQQEDKTFVKVSTLNFTASHSHHEKNITCSAAYSREALSVSLVSAHVVTLVKFSAQILSSSNCTGDLSQMSCWCEAEGNPSPLIQWYFPGVSANISITNEALSNSSVRSVITVKEPQWREAVTLICHSSNSQGSDEHTFTVQAFQRRGRPTNTRVTVSPSGPVAEHSNMSLKCSSDASPPVQSYRWYKADGEAHTLIGNTSVLNMEATTGTAAIFCESRNDLGSDNSTITPLDIQYSPRNTTISVPAFKPVTEPENVTLKCSSDANPAVKHYRWYKTDGGSLSLIGDSAVLNIKMSKGTSRIFCEALNDLGADRSTVTQLLVNYQPRNTRVTADPQSSVREFGNVSLTCSSDASPAVQLYRWYKADEGTLTLIGNSSVLNVKASKDTTAIFCQTQNELGTDNSTLIQLDVLYPPRNTTISSHSFKQVVEHDNVTLKCRSDANPAVKHYRWYKTDGGAHSLIGKSSVLNIRASKDTSRLYCEALNDLGTDRSGVTQLDVQYEPRNTKVAVSPRGSLTEHSNVTLKCKSDASPTVQHYRWFTSQRGTRTLIGNFSVLHIEASRDITAVFCEAQNELGTNNSTVTYLDVLYRPRHTTVTVTPSGPLSEHSTVTLKCSSEANPAVKHYRWYKVDEGGHSLIGKSAVLSMNASKDTTRLYCEAQNDLGTADSSVTQLNVQYPPTNTRVTLTPSGSLLEHRSVTLKCSSEANPAVQHFRWHNTDGETLNENSPVLKMNTSKDTPGIFCSAQNGFGTDKSSVVHLDVQFSPQILRSSNCTGDAAQMSCWCEAEGNPMPRIQWYLPGISSNHIISSEPQSERALRSVITVTKPHSRDPFTLVCHSSNSLGTDRQQLYAQSFQQEGNGAEVSSVLLIAIVCVLLVIMGVLLGVIRTQNINLQKPRATDVALDQIPESNELQEDTNIYANANEVLSAAESNIYANASEVKAEEQAESEVSDGNRGNDQASDSAQNDVVYTTVNWKTKSKKKAQEPPGDVQPSCSSYLEEQRSIVGDRGRCNVSEKLAEREYAQVKFKPKKAV